jgi:hypothetical protein
MKTLAWYINPMISKTKVTVSSKTKTLIDVQKKCNTLILDYPNRVIFLKIDNTRMLVESS